MSQSKNNQRSALVTLFVLMLGSLLGCQTGSDRTINLSGKDLKMGTPIQVQPPGTTIAAFSQDGHLYAVDTATGMEVRAYNGKPLYREVNKLVEPLMFTTSGTRLVCLVQDKTETAIVKLRYSLLDWSSGQFKDLGIDVAGGDDSADPLLFIRNQDGYKNTQQTILFAGTHAVLASGATVPLPVGSQFQGWFPDGVMILAPTEAKGRYRGLWPDGSIRNRKPPTDAELQSATVRRSQMELTPDDVSAEHGRSKALVHALWLTHSEAKKEEDQRDSALVGVGYDLKGFGFVPGRDAVWFNADDGAFVVPFTYEAIAP